MHRALAIAAGGLIGIAAASAQEMPARKAGLWDMKMTFEGRGMPPHIMQQCVDAKTDKLMGGVSGPDQSKDCSKQDIKTSGGAITIDSVCNFGGGTTTSRAVITGSFDQAYTVRVTSTRQGGPPARGAASGEAANMTIEAKWLGACKAGQKPGDVMMPNGMKMNVLEMPGMRPPQR